MIKLFSDNKIDLTITVILLLFLQTIFVPNALAKYGFNLLAPWLAIISVVTPGNRALVLTILASIFLDTLYGTPYAFFTTLHLGIFCIAKLIGFNVSFERNSGSWNLLAVSTMFFMILHHILNLKLDYVEQFFLALQYILVPALIYYVVFSFYSLAARTYKTRKSLWAVSNL